MLPQFDIGTFPSQIFWLIISFGVLLGGMIFIILPKYQKLLNARIHKIKTEVDAAIYLQQEMIKLKKERLQRIENAKEEAQNILEESIQKILTSQVEQIKRAQKDQEILVGKLEKSIEHQRKTILEHVKPFIQHSADEIYHKIKDIKHAS